MRRPMVLSPAALFGFLAIGIAASAAAAEPRVPHNQDAPPGPPLSPQEAIAKMTVPEGFAVELVAAEPELVNPVAMTFDERGRIWVAESLEYPRLEAGEGRDRVKILEDTTGDGRADKVTVFADGLNIPSGIAVGYGGVWVANAPDILFMQDTNGDGRADTREAVITGFGRYDTHELPNSLTWGPDGWLYGLNGVFNRSRVEHQGKVHEFTCALWRLHPRTHQFELFAEGTSNPWGLAWDPEGSAFVSACVIDHLWHLVEGGYYHRQAGAYPPHTWKIESIVGHRHQKAAYCGLHYFDSDAYPPQYRDRLYMGNIHGAAINVDSLSRNGATYAAHGHDDFLQAHDAWFMPIVQKTGPDGCLYVLDWYDRYHCYQDARRDPEGIDRSKGRLYRIRYGDSPRAPAFDLSQASDAELIALLASPNVYFRDLAQRLLAERRSPAALAQLEALVLDENTPRKQRLHALWAVIGAGDLAPDFHEALLTHGDATVRAWGVRAAGNMGRVDERILAQLTDLFADSSPDVRLQLAIAANKIEGFEPLEILVDVLARSGDDPLIPRIVWLQLHPLLDEHERAAAIVFGRYSEISPGVARLAPRVLKYWLAGDHPATQPVVDALERMLARGQSSAAASDCLDEISQRLQKRTLSATCAAELQAALAERLLRELDASSDSPLAPAAACLLASWGDEQGLEASLAILAASDGDESRRLQAATALVAARHRPTLDAADELLCDNQQAGDFQRRLIFALSAWDDPRVGELLIARYQRLDPAVQPAAVAVLSERSAWAKGLLAAIDRREIPREALNENQVRRMLKSPDKSLAKAVNAVWGTLRTERNPDREQAILAVREMLARTPGDPHAGVAVFDKACAQCHKIHGRGEEVGPDLTGNGRNSWDQLLSNVFDPSLVIGAGYQPRLAITDDGRSFTGLVVEESDEALVLKLQGGKVETIPRGQIEQMETIALSLMPEGVERQLSEQELADLMAFLALDRPPDDPEARLLDGAPVGKR